MLRRALDAALPRDMMTQLLTAGQNLEVMLLQSEFGSTPDSSSCTSIDLHLSFYIPGCLQQ